MSGVVDFLAGNPLLSLILLGVLLFVIFVPFPFFLGTSDREL